MKETPLEYTPVDLSRWARKEHFEVFQSFAQCTFNQTVLLGKVRISGEILLG